MNQLSDQEFELIRDLDLSGISSVPASAFEKDLHITKVLKILSGLDLGDWRMIFCGGTSLSKAHGVINRMSEDVDLKLVRIDGTSTSQKRRQLSIIKAQLKTHLGEPGYPVETLQSGNNNGYFSFNLDYAGRFQRSLSLRPQIKIELVQTENPSGVQCVEIKNLYGRFVDDQSEKSQFECVSIEQTLSEKVVAFLRRSHSSVEWDPRLVRHLYDVHEILAKWKLGQDFVNHFQAAVEFDRLRNPERNPEFYQRPLEVMSESAKALKNKSYEEDYEKFARDLTFGESPNYREIVNSFSQIAETLLTESRFLSNGS